MLTKKVHEALNNQINEEFYSSYLYLSMAAHFDSINLKGFANWMRVQVQEENFHATRFFDYVLSRQGKVTLKTIEAPANTWKSPLAIFEAAYAHEQKISGLINKLAAIAQSENDFATGVLLQWFITEQVEEESNVDSVVQQLKLIDKDTSGLFMLDRELATRVFVPPTVTAP